MGLRLSAPGVTEASTAPAPSTRSRGSMDRWPVLTAAEEEPWRVSTTPPRPLALIMVKLDAPPPQRRGPPPELRPRRRAGRQRPPPRRLARDRVRIQQRVPVDVDEERRVLVDG